MKPKIRCPHCGGALKRKPDTIVVVNRYACDNSSCGFDAYDTILPAVREHLISGTWKA